MADRADVSISGYQGYINYETWFIATELINDESSYNTYYSDSKTMSQSELAHIIEMDIDVEFILERDMSLYNDILSEFFARVNWSEVAGGFYDED